MYDGGTDAIYFFFFFNDTATTEIYTLSLHDALPIFVDADFSEHYFTLLEREEHGDDLRTIAAFDLLANNADRKSGHCLLDRKSTRLNSSHANISYAVFCLKKKKNHNLISTLYHLLTS